MTDIVVTYEWIALLDDNTCEDCADLDGQEFEAEDLPDLPQHSNCRCDLIPIINDGEFDE